MRRALFTLSLLVVGLCLAPAMGWSQEWPSGHPHQAVEIMLPDTAFDPPPCIGRFVDVACPDNIFANWIELLFVNQITLGCQPPPGHEGEAWYCPDSHVTRAEMAAFLERAMQGTAGWTPGDITEVTTGVDSGLVGGAAAGAADLAIATDGVRTEHIGGGQVTLSKLSAQPSGAGEVLGATGPGGDLAWLAAATGTVTSVGASGGSTGLTFSGSPITSSGTFTLAGTLALASGGTGATTAAGARTSLGLGSMALQNADAVDISGGGIKVPEITATTAFYGDLVGTATAAVSFTGALAGDVTGTQAATTVTRLQGRPVSTAAPSSNQVLKWNGSLTAWTPSADADTQYTAGVGLQLVGTQFSVDPSVLSVPRPGFALTTHDASSNSGYYSSVTVGSDGLPIVAYRAGNDLKVVHCEDLACTSATITAVDVADNAGMYASITIGSDGFAIISYYGHDDDDLKVAHCSNVACTAATIATIDSTGVVGYYSSITIGSDGLGLIAYKDVTSGTLKVAHCDNVACSAATTATIDSTSSVIADIALTIGADGLGLISYRGGAIDVMVAHCSDVTCSTATRATLDTGDAGFGTAIAIGSDGLGLVTYFESVSNELKVAHCSNLACSASTSAVVGSAGGVYPSITIGADGLAVIAYVEANSLTVAHCGNTTCSSSTTTVVDGSGAVYGYTAVTIGTDGFPLVSFCDYTSDDLRVAHCSNVFCVPYHRRR